MILLRLPNLTDSASDSVRLARTYLNDLATPTLRLGVTGLSRAGKTVFITALVRTLTEGCAVPSIQIMRRPAFRAFLEPQPNDELPRFAYEAHLAALTDDQPKWPESTTQISQLRVTLEWNASDWLRRTFGVGRRLHMDIIDYPGEWLVDLAMLEQSFEAWSEAAIEASRKQPRNGDVDAWLSFLERIEREEVASKLKTNIAKTDERSTAQTAEQMAIEGAALYTSYLAACQRNNTQAVVLGPGRFVMPGDLAGSPLLTFFPLAAGAGGQKSHHDGGRLELEALLRRRYESYRLRVVKPFFEDHFSQLDRQIVLVDALSALNGGADRLHRLEDGLDGVLAAFKPGANSWLAALMGRRIDRVLFAATKADLLNRRNHDRLRGILSAVVSRASDRAEGLGAAVACQAISGLRATEDVEMEKDGEIIPCIQGIPLRGEAIGGRIFDGVAPAVIFPGDLPSDPLEVFEGQGIAEGSLNFIRFQPPSLSLNKSGTTMPPWPHIGLGPTLQFLIGDRLT